MQAATIRLSVPILLFVLVWLPELRLTLGVLFGVGADNAASMRLLVAFVELLFVALKLVEERELRLPARLSPLLLPGALWLVWMVLAALFSGHLSVALLRTAEWTTHALFFTFLVAHLQQHEGRVKEVTHSLLAGFVLVFAWSIYAFTALDIELFSAVPGFTHIRHFGHFAVIVLLLSMAYDERPTFSAGFLFRKTVMVAAWTALFMAAGRGPLVAIAVVTVALAARGYFTDARRVLVPFAIGAVIGLLLSLVYSFPDWGVYRMFSSVSEAEGGDALSSGRLSIWAGALGDVLHHPLFGMGPEGFLYGSGTLFYSILHPHDFLLQALVEWGVPGALLFAYLLYRLLWPAFLHAKDKNSAITDKVLFWVVAVVLCYSFLTGNLYIPFSLFLFVVCLALLTARTAGGGTVVVKSVAALPLLLLLSSLMVVQVYALSAFVDGGMEGVSAREKQIVKAVPAFAVHPMAPGLVVEWARDSAANGNEDEAMAWLDWGIDTLPRNWIYAVAKAELLAAGGKRDEALATLPPAERIPPYSRDQLECIAARIADEE